MEFLQIDNISLAYEDQNSTASKTIVFVHGNSLSSKMWQKQFNSELLKEFRLIAFDLPAHGNSSATPNPEKDYQNFILYFSEILARAIEILVPDSNFILVGYSLGTNIIAEMLSLNIKPKGIAIMSADVVGPGFPFPKVFLPNAKTEIFLTDEISRQYLESWFSEQAPLLTNQHDLNSIYNDFLSVKPPFRSALLNFIINGKKQDEVQLLKNFNQPILLIFGCQDQAVDINYLDNAGLPLWNNTIYKIEGGCHFVNMEQHHIVNELIADYALNRFKASHF